MSSRPGSLPLRIRLRRLPNTGQGLRALPSSSLGNSTGNGRAGNQLYRVAACCPALAIGSAEVRPNARTVLGVVAALLAPAGVHATPADFFGFGPRSQALAGTGTALGQGFETTYSNPALLSRSEQPEAALGWQAAHFSIDVHGPGVDPDITSRGLAGTYFGLVLPLPLGGPLQDRIAVGVGTFSPQRLLVRARVLAPERPQLPLLSDQVQSLNAAAGLGVDLGYGLSLGMGALALAQVVGDVVVSTNSDGRVGAQVEEQMVAAYTPVAGLAWDLDGETFLGAAWRGALRADFDLLVRVEDLGELRLPELNISGVAQYDPMQLQVEIGQRWQGWAAAVGATYQRWSAFHGWLRATVTCPGEAPSCEALPTPRIDFQDTIVPRVGVERTLELGPQAIAAGRLGYFFEPSPLPEQSEETNLWDNHRHALTLGYGVEVQRPVKLSLDFFYQLHLLVPRTHEKSTQVATSNPGHPRVRVSGSVHNTGLVGTLRF